MLEPTTTNTTSRMPTSGRTRQPDFAGQLAQYMGDKRMTQSQLATEVWGSTTDSRGYKVARNRDRISAYLKGAGIPEPENLRKIAAALGCTPEDLMGPDAMNRPLTRARNPSEVQLALMEDPTLMQIQINMILPVAQAMELVTLAQKFRIAAETEEG